MVIDLAWKACSAGFVRRLAFEGHERAVRKPQLREVGRAELIAKLDLPLLRDDPLAMLRNENPPLAVGIHHMAIHVKANVARHVTVDVLQENAVDRRAAIEHAGDILCPDDVSRLDETITFRGNL